MPDMARDKASSVTKAFALRLIATRESAGYDVKARFADDLGVPSPTYRKWERGGAEPKYADLVKIQNLTGVSLDFLIAGRAPVVASLPEFRVSARKTIRSR